MGGKMENLKRILVPVDFSEISERIAAAALYVATQYQAHLWIVYVVEDIASYSGVMMNDFPLEEFTAEITESAEKRMASFVAEHFKGSALSHESVVLQGHVAEEILAFSREHKIDLIVIGTHGYRGLKKMLMGSVADEVIKHASCPVLSLR